MRTQEQILDRIKEIKEEDFFGFATGVLVGYLDFEHAKPFLKDEVTKDQWKPSTTVSNYIVEEMKDYMHFAWEKALNHRGLSAGRSVQKMETWLWMIEDDELLEFIKEDGNYSPYGGPILKKICEKYKFEIPEGESAKNLGNGKPCHPGCEEGCRS